MHPLQALFCRYQDLPLGPDTPLALPDIERSAASNLQRSLLTPGEVVSQPLFFCYTIKRSRYELHLET
jgi:hypothetical protein